MPMLYLGLGTSRDIDLIRAYLLLIEPGNSRNHWNESLIRGITSDFADPETLQPIRELPEESRESAKPRPLFRRCTRLYVASWSH